MTLSCLSDASSASKKANGNYSARALDSTDNQKAGSRLATWYNDDRILDGDAFYVNVKQPPARAGRLARSPPRSVLHGDSWITKRSKSR
ncbi:hypothetical protein ACFZDJ_47885 [Streptomyces sp. NPDC007896]|uniref:hypothetical protein n=1 Tax=Streptomyces sp. NPDC007896 TaxID=3364784 RepID=UPI0036EBDA0A